MKTKKPSASPEFTLELELCQDSYYPDFHAIFLKTEKDSSMRIAGGKATGSWKTLRTWTATISSNDLKRAKTFSKAQEKRRMAFREKLFKEAEERRIARA